ncbi:unnamed protein product, partial [Brenthis ino]
MSTYYESKCKMNTLLSNHGRRWRRVEAGAAGPARRRSDDYIITRQITIREHLIIVEITAPQDDRRPLDGATNVQ